MNNLLIKCLLGTIFLFLIVKCTNSGHKDNLGAIPPKGFVEINGTKLSYVAEGKGIPCLVIGSSIYYPRTFSKQLREHLQFYFVDMRWFAKEYSQVKPESYTLDTIISDIEKIRTALKLDKFIIMGHSIHGTIAYEYALRYPDKISHLVMLASPNNQSNQVQEEAINSMWNTASAERKKLMNANWKILTEMKNLSPAEFDVEVYCLMGPKYWYNPTYDAHWLWKDMSLNTDLLHYLYDGIFSNYYMFRNERSVPLPTFVAGGKYDYVDPVSLWKGYDDVKGLTVSIFNKSGHTPQLEEAELFDSLLMSWINENKFHN